MNLRLDWCSHSAAKYAVESWHYSRSMPTPPVLKIGTWENGIFIGAVLFSRGANNNIGRAYDLEPTEVAELTRVALSDHNAPVSRIIKVALIFLKRSSPGLKAVISYADPSRGHYGGIYQAGGWIYVGKSSDSTEYISPDGRQWHGRMVSATGLKRVYSKMRRVWRHDQCEPVTMPGKHKYIMPLDNQMRARLKELSKPYPKRQPVEVSDSNPKRRCDSDPDAPLSETATEKKEV